MNLIERLWKFLKQKALSRWHKTFEAMQEAVSEVLDHLDEYRAELTTLMTEQFQLHPRGQDGSCKNSGRVSRRAEWFTYAIAVRAEHNAEDAVDMTSKCILLLAGGGVPDPNALLRAGRDQLSCRDEPLAVRTERDATGTLTAIVRIVSTYFLAAGRIPEHHFLIAARRGEPLAVGTEGDAANVRFTVAAKHAQFLAGVRLPDANGSIVAHGNEPLAVGTEGNVIDRFGVALERAHSRPAFFAACPRKPEDANDKISPALSSSQRLFLMDVLPRQECLHLPPVTGGYPTREACHTRSEEYGHESGNHVRLKRPGGSHASAADPRMGRGLWCRCPV